MKANRILNAAGTAGLEKAKQITSSSDPQAEAEAVISGLGGKVGGKVGEAMKHEKGVEFANRVNSLQEGDYAGLVKVLFDVVNWGKKEGAKVSSLDM